MIFLPFLATKSKIYLERGMMQHIEVPVINSIILPLSMIFLPFKGTEILILPFFLFFLPWARHGATSKSLLFPYIKYIEIIIVNKKI